MTKYHNGKNGWTVCPATQKCRLGGEHIDENVAKSLKTIERYAEITEDTNAEDAYKDFVREFSNSIRLTKELQNAYGHFMNADKAHYEASLVIDSVKNGEQKYLDAEEVKNKARETYSALVASLDPDDVVLNGIDFMENKILKGEHFQTRAEEQAGLKLDATRITDEALEESKDLIQNFDYKIPEITVSYKEIDLFKSSPKMLNTFRHPNITGENALQTYNNAIRNLITEHARKETTRYPLTEGDRIKTVQFLRKQLQQTALEEYKHVLDELTQGTNTGFLNKVQAVALHKQKGKVLKTFFKDLNEMNWSTKIGY